jgi:hypothetical protein
LGLYTGFFKAFQNAGAASGWKIDASHVPYIHFLIACWVLIFISFPGAFWVAFTTEETTGYREEIEQDKQERIEHEKLGKAESEPMGDIKDSTNEDSKANADSQA